MDKAEIRIRGFLKLGYFVDATEQKYPLDFSRIDKAAYAGWSEDDLVTTGLAKLEQTFRDLFDAGRDNVLPLSGGYDSRLILAALLERTPASSIHTFTYGVPGAFDYEIGCAVAKAVGTRHVAFPLDKFTYHMDELLDVARRTRCQATLFNHPPIGELSKRYGGAVIWSGYVGDAVVGSHLHDPPSATLDEAKRRYLSGRAFVRSTNLHQCDDDVFMPYISGGDLDPAVLTWDEQVLFDEGVRKFTEPLVLYPDFEYRTPLINTPWSDYMFSVPNAHRRNQRLMLTLGARAFPQLFAMPSKKYWGLSPSAHKSRVFLQQQLSRARKLVHRLVPSVSYPTVLYNDFNEALRTSPDLRGIVRECLAGLKQRGIAPWVDVDALWKRHARRLGNLGDALTVLASLELVHRAREQAG